MAELTVKQGMNLNLAGRPAAELGRLPPSPTVAVCPPEFHGVKPRLLVKEGDRVGVGTPLLFDKRNEQFRICSPGPGTVESIQYGARRVIQKIVIRAGEGPDTQASDPMSADQCLKQSREDVLHRLLESGYLAHIRQRPFSRMADAAATPKSIFVNACDTAPFHTDPAVAIHGHKQAFQAGLNLLTRLTDGRVHLVLPGDRTDLPAALTQAHHCEIHHIIGPHPSGNVSVHIHHLDPIVPGDVVWTLRAEDLVQIGRLFTDGRPPADRVVALGGPVVKAPARKHYRVPVGGELEPLFNGSLQPGESRTLVGDILSGVALNGHTHLPFYVSGFTVIAENRERRFLGWLAPGLDRFSASKAYLSAWARTRSDWELGTNRNGSPRAMVLTGLYDRYLPMNIMVDYLVRAVLANDTEEAIQLGILETDPEDFALCSFVCPSKMNVSSIIRKGLDMIEQEGI